MIRNVPEKLYREFFISHPDDYVFPETPNRNLVEFVRQSKRQRGKASAVDLGCGEGRSSVFLAREGFDVLAIDLSPTIIRKGIERFGRRREVNYSVAELTSLPVRSGNFDLAVDITTLNNQKSRNRRKYVQEIRRALKENGCYYASVVSTKDPSCRNKCPKRHFILRKNGSYQQFYSTRILKKLFSPYFCVVSMKERKDGVSAEDEFESIEVIAERKHI